MPLYEYQCEDCKKQSELLVNHIDSKPNCPECGSKRMSKQLSVISAPVVQSGRSTAPQEGTCGRSQCARGCVFGN